MNFQNLNEDEIRDLLLNINGKSPSVLFLGQNYKEYSDCINVYCGALNKKAILSQMVKSGTDIFDAFAENHCISENQIHVMRDVLSGVDNQRWLRNIVSLRWNAVMTSSIDAVLIDRVGDDFEYSLVPIKDRFSRKYSNKNTKNISFLFGNIQDADGCLIRDISENNFEDYCEYARARIGWIYDYIIADYGTLVIDGWDCDSDWADFLLDNAGRLHQKSIYLFSAKNSDLENKSINRLVNKGIIVFDSRTFYEAASLVDFFEESDTSEIIDTVLYKEVMVDTIDGRVSQRIPYEKIEALNSSIFVLSEEDWKDKSELMYKDLYPYFLGYRKGTAPLWYLYKPQYPFYFKRTIEDKVLDLLKKEAQKSGGYKRRPVMVMGNSNVGKTSLLIHIGYKLHEAGIPVIFVQGDPSDIDNTNKWQEQLKLFIKTYFNEIKGRKTVSCVVIWDNSDFYSKNKCENLQSYLHEVNALVLGSGYERRSEIENGTGNTILLEGYIDENECKELVENLKQIDSELADRFSKRVNEMGSKMLLKLLLKMANFQFSEEWKSIEIQLKQSFIKEAKASEELVGGTLSKYEEDNVESCVRKYGVAASWQLQLAEIMKTLGEEQKANCTNKENNAKIENVSAYQKHVQTMNSVLAMAGQFRILLPVNLVMRAINRESDIVYSDERKFIYDILFEDSLLMNEEGEYGEYLVGFRSPEEAEFYVTRNFGNDEDERKDNQVKLLQMIINICNWDDIVEQKQVIQLIRSFGPNSYGTPSKPQDKHAINRRWLEFTKYWNEIANSISYHTEFPEVCLVYSVLKRHYFRDVLHNEGETCAELTTIRAKLDENLRSNSVTNDSQRGRLLGEYCTNVVASMIQSEESAKNGFSALRTRFREAVSLLPNHSNPEFNSNNLLDIWLNGRSNYLATCKNIDENEKTEILAQTLQYINELFVVDESLDSPAFLEKINSIYSLCDDNMISQTEEKLRVGENDTALYLKAWKCWKHADESEQLLFVDKNYCDNLYVLPDDFDRYADIICWDIARVREMILFSAQKSSQLLENNLELIKKAKSARCMQMLIKSKWIEYTGRMPLENKQWPALAIQQWHEMGELCELCIEYAIEKNEHISRFVYLIRAVYTWCFSDCRGNSALTKATNAFCLEQLRLEKTSSWFFKKISITNNDTKTQQLYRISISRDVHTNHLFATILEAVDGNLAIDKYVIMNGKKIRLDIRYDGRLLSYLNLSSDVQNVAQIKKPVVIWFNAIGNVSVGMPDDKEGEE